MLIKCYNVKVVGKDKEVDQMWVMMRKEERDNAIKRKIKVDCSRQLM